MAHRSALGGIARPCAALSAAITVGGIVGPNGPRPNPRSTRRFSRFQPGAAVVERRRPGGGGPTLVSRAGPGNVINGCSLLGNGAEYGDDVLKVGEVVKVVVEVVFHVVVTLIVTVVVKVVVEE